MPFAVVAAAAAAAVLAELHWLKQLMQIAVAVIAIAVEAAAVVVVAAAAAVAAIVALPVVVTAKLGVEAVAAVQPLHFVSTGVGRGYEVGLPHSVVDSRPRIEQYLMSSKHSNKALAEDGGFTQNR